MKIELPYLSKIVLEKRNNKKTFICFNRGFFEIENIDDNEDILIDNTFVDRTDKMKTKNYVSLCSVQEFSVFMNKIAQSFVSGKTLKKNFEPLYSFEQNIYDCDWNFRLKEVLNETKKQIGLGMSNDVSDETIKNKTIFLSHLALFLMIPKEFEKILHIGETEIVKYNVIEDYKKDICFLGEKMDILRIHNNQICVVNDFNPNNFLCGITKNKRINVSILKNILVNRFMHSKYHMKNEDTKKYTFLTKNKLDYKHSNYPMFDISSKRNLNTRDFLYIQKILTYISPLCNIKIEENIDEFLNSDNFRLFYESMKNVQNKHYEKMKIANANNKYGEIRKYPSYEKLIDYINKNSNTVEQKIIL